MVTRLEIKIEKIQFSIWGVLLSYEIISFCLERGWKPRSNGLCMQPISAFSLSHHWGCWELQIKGALVGPPARATHLKLSLLATQEIFLIWVCLSIATLYCTCIGTYLAPILEVFLKMHLSFTFMTENSSMLAGISSQNNAKKKCFLSQSW